jgi:TPR repeat protein
MKLFFEKFSQNKFLRFLAVGSGIALIAYAILLPDPQNKSKDGSIQSVSAAPLVSASFPSTAGSEPPDRLPRSIAATPSTQDFSASSEGRVAKSVWIGENPSVAEQLRFAAAEYLDAMLPRDFSESNRELRSAAEKGNSMAQYLLGHDYEMGQGVAKDLPEMLRWYALAAEGRTSASSGSVLGSDGFDLVAAGRVKDFSQALDLCRRAAEGGDATAQLYLGLVYDLGRDVPGDPAEAARWYRKSALQGNGAAANNLGVLHDNAQGIPKDSVEAAEWLKIAASRGNALGEYNLGLLYLRGEGVSQDDSMAARNLEKAADRGIAPAQVLLSFLYSTGKGVPGSNAEAYMWINLASASQTRARTAREEVEKMVAYAEVAEGQRLTHAWLVQHSRLRN